MIKKIITPLFALIALAVTGCSGMLDKIAPRDQIPQDALSIEDMQKLLNGLYAQMETHVFNAWFDHDLTGENLKAGPGHNITDAVGMSAGDSRILSRWQNSFTTLSQVNFMIESYESAGNSSMDAMGGVGYYFRALIYYNLVTRWGNVPIVRKRTYDVVPISPEAQVWDFLKSDLEKALALTPAFSDRFYVSLPAVQALAARVYLALGDNEQAASYAASVIGNSAFKLASTSAEFAQPFVSGTTSKEVVFALANKRSASYLSYANQINDVDATWNYSAANDRYASLFEDDDNVTRLADLRKAATFSDDPNRVIKFPNGIDGQQLVPTENQANTPVVVTRIAEMYLIRAEALGKEDGASVMVDFLTKRYATPPSEAQLKALSDKAWQNLILDERNREFFAEGFRWYDIKRTGRTDLLLSLGDRDYLMYYPIPQTEIDLAGKEAYPQNNGY